MNVFETLLNHCELYFYSQQECSVLFKLSRRGKHKIIIRMRHFKSVFCLKVSLYLIPQIWKEINITGSSLVFSSFENYRTKEMPCSIEIHYYIDTAVVFFCQVLFNHSGYDDCSLSMCTYWTLCHWSLARGRGRYNCHSEKLANSFTLQFVSFKLQTDRVRNELATRPLWSFKTTNRWIRI